MADELRALDDVAVITRTHVEEVTAKEIGSTFVNERSDVQAEILHYMAEAVDAMSRKGGSWPMQCRMIAESLYQAYESPELCEAACYRVRSMLETLTDHLESIPREEG